MEQIVALRQEITEDQSIHYGYENSGLQFYNNACNFFKKEIDILDKFDLVNAYNTASGEELRAYYCVAVLQNRMCNQLLARSLLPTTDVTETEKWFQSVMEAKLRDKILAEDRKVPVKHMWIQ